MAADNAACCAAGPPVDAKYEGRGEVVSVGDLSVYVVGEGERCIVLAYDIFGFDIPQTRQNCDDLAAAGFTVVMADHFFGKPWDLANFPPKDGSDIGKWLAKDAPWDKTKAELESVFHFMRGRGAKSFGLVGFCWGGRVAMSAASELNDTLSCVAAVHAAFVGGEDGENAKIPVLFAPSGTDPDLAPVKAALDKKPFAAANVFHTFADQIHGFAVARGDRSDPKVAAAVKQLLSMLVEFFNANIKQ